MERYSAQAGLEKLLSEVDPDRLWKRVDPNPYRTSIADQLVFYILLMLDLHDQTEQKNRIYT